MALKATDSGTQTYETGRIVYCEIIRENNTPTFAVDAIMDPVGARIRIASGLTLSAAQARALAP